eukprot:19106-Heterococcus_DN1.PRE.4
MGCTICSIWSCLDGFEAARSGSARTGSAHRREQQQNFRRLQKILKAVLHCCLILGYQNESLTISAVKEGAAAAQNQRTVSQKSMLQLRCIALLCIVFSAAAFTSNALHRANGFVAERICKRATARACTQGCVMHLKDNKRSLSRRDAVRSAVKAAGLSALAIGLSPKPASAGLLLSPPTRLNNRYFLVRAGQSFADAAGQVQSHPIYKLHMSNGLTDLGRKQAERAAASLKSLGAGVDGPGVIIWHDISSRALETANVLCEQLGIGRERVIPEYAFLEPRGMGLWESGNVTVILPALYRADAQNSLWRPPANDDGTPHESVQDVLVRVRQLMSKLETQYSGEDIVLVSPDSDCLSILQHYGAQATAANSSSGLEKCGHYYYQDATAINSESTCRFDNSDIRKYNASTIMLLKVVCQVV